MSAQRAPPRGNIAGARPDAHNKQHIWERSARVSGCMQFVTIKYANASFILCLERIRKRAIWPCCAIKCKCNTRNPFQTWKEDDARVTHGTWLRSHPGAPIRSSCKVVCCFRRRNWSMVRWNGAAKWRGFTFTAHAGLSAVVLVNWRLWTHGVQLRLKVQTLEQMVRVGIY